MSQLYREARVCECGYATTHRGNWSTHKKRCATHATIDPEKEQLREQLAAKDEQLAATREQLALAQEQLATKDELLVAQAKQIDELLQAAKEERKRPRTVNNNLNSTVNNHINVFGKESLAHITEAKLQELLSDPYTSVARLVTLKHSVEENQNVKVPNAREKWVQVLVEGEDGQREWQAVPKGDILSEIVESNAMLLEGEADESTVPGERYSRWHDQLRDSQEQNGRMFKDQMDLVHKVIVESTRKPV